MLRFVAAAKIEIDELRSCQAKPHLASDGNCHWRKPYALSLQAPAALMDAHAGDNAASTASQPAACKHPSPLQRDALLCHLEAAAAAVGGAHTAPHSSPAHACSATIFCPCRETRYFATWKRRRQWEEHTLPGEVAAITGQAACPFGDAGMFADS